MGRSNVLGLWVAAWLVEGITYDGFWWLVFAALVFGLVNLFLRPLAHPADTAGRDPHLGLLLLFINAFMLWLTGAIFADNFEVADFFWAAVLGAIVIWLVNLRALAAHAAATGALRGRRNGAGADRLPALADVATIAASTDVSRGERVEPSRDAARASSASSRARSRP